MPGARPLRVGVVGVGLMGAEHVRLLADEVSGSAVTAMCDADAARAERVAAGVGAQALPDVEALVAADVDAVLVASSDATHEAAVLTCLSVGKPVLCEKPLAPDVDGCERVLAAEAAAGRRLVSVGFMRRFDPGHRRLQRAVGDLGAALLVHCVHRNAAAGPTPPEVIMTGSAVHEVDAVRWLLGEEVTEVTVHRPRASALARTQDPLLLVLRTDGGTLVDVEVFVNAQYGYEVRCEVVGERGTATLAGPAEPVVRTAGGTHRAVPADWRGRFAEAYRLELQDWVDALTTGAPTRCASAWDGAAATAVAAAGVAALHSGRTEPVRLPERTGRQLP